LLFLNSAPAVVSYFVLPTALNILGALWAPLREVQPWIDLWASQAPLFSGQDLSAQQWAQIGTSNLMGGTAVRPRAHATPPRRGEVTRTGDPAPVPERATTNRNERRKTMTTPRTTGRIVGGLFLLAFLVYGGGTALVNTAAGTPVDLADVGDNQLQIATGALLMLSNAAVVAATGILVFPILRRHHQLTACTYLVTRVFEAVLLAVGVLFVLLLLPLGQGYGDAGAGDPAAAAALGRLAGEGNFYSYQIAMLMLGIGAMVFCRALWQARLVPSPLAIWGIVGYALFTTGAILEVLGYEVSLVLSIPGALFEVGLGVLLLIRGFPATQHQDTADIVPARRPMSTVL
jgi:hypothetical protein